MGYITTIQGVINHLRKNSTWSKATVENVITALGYNPADDRLESLKKLSGNFADCSKHGADGGFSGFTFYSDTIAFFLNNCPDIIKNLALLAEEIGEDIIKMIQGFGMFRYATPPSVREVGKALWDTGKVQGNLTALYNVFSWFCLEEMSHIWYRYLEDNPDYYAALTA